MIPRVRKTPSLRQPPIFLLLIIIIILVANITSLVSLVKSWIGLEIKIFAYIIANKANYLIF